VRLDDAVELLILVAAGDEQRTVEEVSEAGAEDVEARIDVGRRLSARGRVIHGGTREVLHREALGRAVPDRVPREHLAIREQ
jgi:hypothetical protein